MIWYIIGALIGIFYFKKKYHLKTIQAIGRGILSVLMVYAAIFLVLFFIANIFSLVFDGKLLVSWSDVLFWAVIILVMAVAIKKKLRAQQSRDASISILSPTESAQSLVNIRRDLDDRIIAYPSEIRVAQITGALEEKSGSPTEFKDPSVLPVRVSPPAQKKNRDSTLTPILVILGLFGLVFLLYRLTEPGMQEFAPTSAYKTPTPYNTPPVIPNCNLYNTVYQDDDGETICMYGVVKYADPSSDIDHYSIEFSDDRSQAKFFVSGDGKRGKFIGSKGKCVLGVGTVRYFEDTGTFPLLNQVIVYVQEENLFYCDQYNPQVIANLLQGNSDTLTRASGRASAAVLPTLPGQELVASSSITNEEWDTLVKKHARNLAIQPPYLWEFYELPISTRYADVRDHYYSVLKPKGFRMTSDFQGANEIYLLKLMDGANNQLIVQFWGALSNNPPAVLVFYKGSW